MTHTQHGDKSEFGQGRDSSADNNDENRVQPIFDAPTQSLSFDERTKLSFRRDDGVLMVPNLDTPFLPDGGINYVPRPAPKNEGIPCEFIPPDGLTLEAAFVPASTVWTDHFDHYEEFKRFLNNHSEIRTWKPSKQRLCVHAGDWHRHWEQQDQKKTEQLDGFGSDDIGGLEDFLHGAAERNERIRQKKANQTRS